MGTGLPASLFKKADLLYGMNSILPKASDTDLVTEPFLSPRMALQSLAWILISQRPSPLLNSLYLQQQQNLPNMNEFWKNSNFLRHKVHPGYNTNALLIVPKATYWRREWLIWPGRTEVLQKLHINSVRKGMEVNHQRTFMLEYVDQAGKQEHHGYERSMLLPDVWLSSERLTQ